MAPERRTKIRLSREEAAAVAPHETNQVQAEFWEAAGPVWHREQARLDEQINHHSLKAIDSLNPTPGETVVDIGCGTGTTTFQIAERVGVGGLVVGCDISATMVDAARARASALGVENVEFVTGDAHTHQFDPVADAVFSRFGVMFFGDPKGAFANIRTALRPAGRLVFVCWQSPDRNPWVTKPLEVARKYVTLPFATDPRAPSPFAFADPEWVHEVLADAGFSDVTIEPHEAQAYLGADLDSAVRFVLGLNPATAGIAERDPATAKTLFAEVADALRPHSTGQGVVTDSATWVVSAAIPA